MTNYIYELTQNYRDREGKPQKRQLVCGTLESAEWSADFQLEARTAGGWVLVGQTITEHKTSGQ